ncbi:MAG: cupredoxin domain-containing protein [Nitrososphaera sp.]|jgi:plastocyanin
MFSVDARHRKITFGIFFTITAVVIASSPIVLVPTLAQQSTTSVAPQGVQGQGQLQSPLSSSADNNNSSGILSLEEARQAYLLAWNNTAFNATFNTFIEPGTALGYGVFEEHESDNVFAPGEPIILYVEIVGFAHEPVLSEQGETLYHMAMTADYIISDDQGNELQRIPDVPAGDITSHRMNTELFFELTLTQESPFPEGDYVITYIIEDSVSGDTFEISKAVQIADSGRPSSSGSASLPEVMPPQEEEQESGQADSSEEEDDDNRNTMEEHEVEIQGNDPDLESDATYEPANLEINVGDRVIWKNEDDFVHTATKEPSGLGDFFGGVMAPDETFDFVFTEPGEYQYYCTLHPNKVGTITVK